MEKQFTHLFDSLSATLQHLHFLSDVVSRMTIHRDCLVEFEHFIPSIRRSLSYLKLGNINSLTFGFRVLGFTYASSESFSFSYHKEKGDIVLSVDVTYKDGNFCITLL